MHSNVRTALAFFISTLLMAIPAAVLAAGFATTPLFLSQSSPTQGDTVLIYSPIENNTSSPFSGNLTFSQSDGTPIGTVAVSLNAGGAQIVSVSWTPMSGSQTVKATLDDSGGNQIEQESATFSIAAPPVTTQPVGSSAGIEDAIASTSPALGSVMTPILSTIDGARTAAANALGQGIAWSQQQAEGQVLGASTEASTTATAGWENTAKTVGATILLYLLTALRYVVANVILFYPLLLILILYVLYKLIKKSGLVRGRPYD